MEGHKFAQWTLESQNGFDGLKYDENATVPSLRDEDILVEIHAGSLNYRDLVLAKGALPIPFKKGVVPGSDGAGVVKAVGSAVSSFKIGDKVCVHMVPSIPDEALPTFAHISAGIGAQLDGTLREYGVFNASSLVPMPSNLTFEEAATLGCSALTAWNAVCGLRGRELKRDDWILVQGSGGVSVAALQLAKALGANIVATTGSDAKTARLSELGAAHVINYRNEPHWGETAKRLTPDGRGFDFVVDVGGDSTLSESMAAIRTDGIIAAVGVIGSGDISDFKTPLLSALFNACIVRGVLLGSRQQFRDMNQFIEKNGLQIALDTDVFTLKSAKEAYEKMSKQQHFSKVAIRYR